MGHSFISRLVSHQELEDFGVVAGFHFVQVFHPLLGLFKAQFMGDIVDNECGLGILEVHLGQRVKLLLASRVPDLHFYLLGLAALVRPVYVLGLEACPKRGQTIGIKLVVDIPK